MIEDKTKRACSFLNYNKITGRPTTKQALNREETVLDFVERCFREGMYEYRGGKVFRRYEFRGRGRWLDEGVEMGYLTPVGYVATSLRFNGRYHQVMIHRMIYVAFNGSKKLNHNKLEINHINGVKNDNRIENLELVTSKENKQHSWSMGLMSNEKHGNSKLNWEKVRRIKDKYSTGNYTQKQLAEEFGVIQGTISKVVSEQSWKEGKYSDSK